MSVNIRPYIIINGKSSNEITGLMITSLPPITKPQMRVSAEEIDGRDGDIVTELGYSAYDKPIEIALVGNYDVDEVISYFNQSGIITFSNEPEKYYKFAQYDGIDYEKLIKYKTAKVNFHVQPYKYSTESNDAVFYSPTNVTVTNAGNTNSRPSLAIQGSGDVEIAVNGSQALQIDLGDAKQAIIIDSDEMNAYGTKSNIKELITEINPVQDLNGYDHAWIGGAGKNKLNNDGYFPKNASISNTYYYDFSTVQHNVPEITLQADTTYTLSLDVNTNVTPFNFSVGCGTGGYSADIKALSGFSNGRISITFTPTSAQLENGNILAFRAPRYSSLTSATFTVSNVQLELGSSATSFEPYENICDISGWNGCDITRTGKNLCNPLSLENLYSNYDYTEAGYRCRKIQLAPNTTYTVSFTASSAQSSPIILMNNQTGVNASGYFDLRKASDTKTYTTDETGCLYIGLYPNVSDAVANARLSDCSIQIEQASQATTFEKYVGSKYQSFFEGLMAGKYGFVDLGSLEWSYITSGAVNRFQAPLTISGSGCGDNAQVAKMICSGFGVSSWSNVTNLSSYNKYIAEVSGGGYVAIQDSNFTDAEAFTEAVSGIYLIYELATPTTPSITQEDISNLVADFNADLVCVVFGQEVYGGSLNVTTGLMTITMAIKNETWGNLRNNTVLGTTERRLLSLPLGASMIDTKSLCNVTSWMLDYYSDTPHFYVQDRNMVLCLPVGTDSNLEIEVIYTLANPVEIQLTAQDVMTLIGKNNIMSNTGAISELIYNHAGADVTTSGDIVSFDVDASDLKDNILKNRIVTGNYDNLRLKAGANQLGITGDVDVIVLSNFSRWL